MQARAVKSVLFNILLGIPATTTLSSLRCIPPTHGQKKPLSDCNPGSEMEAEIMKIQIKGACQGSFKEVF